MIDKGNELALVRQCSLLEISRSGVYYRGREVAELDLRLMRLIDEAHLRYPFYGSRRIRDWLETQGHRVNRKKVQRLMSVMGLVALYPKRRTSLPCREHTVHPYRLKGLRIDRPNQVWATDICYLPMARGFLYLVAIMDWYSRKVLAFRLSNTLDSHFCVEALEEALSRYGPPEIFNTDQGAQFTSEAFTGVLKKAGVTISMDGKGRWVDNVFIERLWRSLKYEEVYLKAYESTAEAQRSIEHYFRFYNIERRHQALDRQTPDTLYFGGRMPKAARCGAKIPLIN